MVMAMAVGSSRKGPRRRSRLILSLYYQTLSHLIMLLYLVRHGETSMNGRGIIQGHLDPPLSPTGERQARLLGGYLDTRQFAEVWTSDLQRAEQTARLAVGTHGPRVRVDERLRARYMGSLQGLPWDDTIVYPPDVESEQMVAARMASWLKDVVVAHTPASSPLGSPTSDTGHFIFPPHSEDQVLVIAHEECLHSLMGLLRASSGVADLDDPASPSSPLTTTEVPDHLRLQGHLANTAITVLKVWWEEDEGRVVPRGRVETWGSTEHLGAGD